MLTQAHYNGLDSFDKTLVDTINTDLSNQKETLMTILWCGEEKINPIELAFFEGKRVDSFNFVNPKLHKEINTLYDTDRVGDYVNAAADFYKAMEDLAYDYDGFVLPKNPVFLAHFFYHAGIEMHTDKQEVKCFVSDDDGLTFSTIKVLV